MGGGQRGKVPEGGEMWLGGGRGDERHGGELGMCVDRRREVVENQGKATMT